jgi:hypothetical protein
MNTNYYKICVNQQQNNTNLIPQMVEDYLRSDIGECCTETEKKLM